MEEIFMLAGHFILKSIGIAVQMEKRVYHREIIYFFISRVCSITTGIHIQTQIMAKLIIQMLLQVVRSWMDMFQKMEDLWYKNLAFSNLDGITQISIKHYNGSYILIKEI